MQGFPTPDRCAKHPSPARLPASTLNRVLYLWPTPKFPSRANHPCPFFNNKTTTHHLSTYLLYNGSVNQSIRPLTDMTGKSSALRTPQVIFLLPSTPCAPSYLASLCALSMLPPTYTFSFYSVAAGTSASLASPHRQAMIRPMLAALTPWCE